MNTTPPLDGLLLRAGCAADALPLSVLAMQVFLDTYCKEGINASIARHVLETYTEASYAQALADPQQRLVVAERQGLLLGFGQVTLNTPQALVPAGTQAELLRLYVQEPFTGAKLGTALLAEAERAAAQAGSTVLWLTPWVHNQRARAFYARRGYTDHGLTHFIIDGQAHENRVLAKELQAR
ncbi:GNAT family N-acetyltransferase [Roseateles sp. BYS180W]|uniref:GNAT family N-acetyltransferase n=1 Tax=Roseateles rivi TaxID=3299028 RepID=A0ABW7FSZ7_9BURK